MRNAFVKKKMFAGLFVTSLLALAVPVLAWGQPSLQVSTVDGRNLQITVSGGEPNRTVELYTRQLTVGSWTHYSSIGATDQNGYLNLQFNASGDTGIGRESYVVVAGQQSAIVTSYPSGAGNIWFSPDAASVRLGQTATVSIYGGYSQYYVYSNSNTSVVVASIQGTTLSLYGQGVGTATIRVSTNYFGGNQPMGEIIVQVQQAADSLSFLTTSLPQAISGQYYSTALSVSGGTWPYHFSLTSGSLPVGMLLNDNGTISGMAGQNTTSYFTVRVSDNYGRQATQNFSLVVANTAGASGNKNGMLFQEGRTVYIVYKNTKTGFASENAFIGLGFRFADVQAAPQWYQDSGYVITTVNASHPWGSWVVSGGTVYFIHRDGLIPISSYDIFLNNGGRASYIVPMNFYDWQLPRLSLMAYVDQRLTAQENQSAYTLYYRVGDYFNIELEANPSTGYQWNIGYDSNYLELRDHYFTSYSSMSIGSGGLDRFAFKALRTGQTTVSFSYLRLWENALPLQTKTYTIYIQ